MPSRDQKPLVILAMALSGALGACLMAGAKLIEAEATLRQERAKLEAVKREKFEALDSYREFIELTMEEGCTTD